MAGHSRSKNGVALLAYGPGRPRPSPHNVLKDVAARDKPAHDDIKQSEPQLRTTVLR
jgi:hypothetical protein